MGKDVGTKDGVASGTGNQVSAEFNLFYRWHSCISDRDDKWTQAAYRKMFPGKEPEDLELKEIMMGLRKWDQSMNPDPQKRQYHEFNRGEDGMLDDEAMVKCLTESIEDCGGKSSTWVSSRETDFALGAFGARNVPKILRSVEILGIVQARKWNVAGLNEFRKHFGLKPHERFEDINSDPEIADQLRHLYDHPDFVELYPGIVAEEAKKPMIPGVGICPTYSISRVVLSDAVCLVRGDRFYTTDYHPRNLTSWGYNEVQYDLNVNQGCVFYKLFLKAFPSWFEPDSVYVHYPMTIPSENKKILTNLGRVSHFNFDRPALMPPRVNVTSYAAVRHILENNKTYAMGWNDGMVRILGRQAGLGFMMSGDSDMNRRQRKIMAEGIYKDQWHTHVKGQSFDSGHSFNVQTKC